VLSERRCLSSLALFFLSSAIRFSDMKYRRILFICILCALFVLGTIGAHAWLCTLAFRVKGDHELWYQGELLRIQDLEDPYWRTFDGAFYHERKEPPPYDERVNPAVHDIQQLWSTNIEGQLYLHENGTGLWPAQRYWIYFAGTTAEKSQPLWNFGAYVKSMLNHSSHDPPEMAKAYNEAMNQLSEYFHNEARKEERYWPKYRFVDCDMTPGLCDLFWVDPPVLVYFETKSPCRLRLNPKYDQVCSVRASVVGLPLEKLPYHPTRRTVAGNVVPVFPSPFEQLKMMMTSIDTIEAFGLVDDSVRYIEIDRDRQEADEYGYPILLYEAFLVPRWETLVLGLGRLLGYV